MSVEFGQVPQSLALDSTQVSVVAFLAFSAERCDVLTLLLCSLVRACPALRVVAAATIPTWARNISVDYEHSRRAGANAEQSQCQFVNERQIGHVHRRKQAHQKYLDA